MASLPSQDALTSLPRWALVAYAARCARRVEPLFHKAWPEAPHHLLMAVAEAVHYAEQAAANAYSQKHLAQHHANAADAAAELADRASEVVAESGAYFAAHAAANAVGAVAYESEAIAAAYYAASDASAAISTIADGNPEVILADLEFVGALAREHNWTDETAVPPDIFLVHREADSGTTGSPAGGSEDELAKLEAYYAWERAGRPWLSKEQQDRLYFQALERIRRVHIRDRSPSPKSGL